MSDLSPDLKKLMQVAREELTPPADRIAAVRSSLAARLQNEAAEPSATSTTNTTSTAAGTASPISVKWIGIALMATAFSGALWLSSREAPPANKPQAAPDSAVVAEPAEPAQPAQPVIDTPPVQAPEPPPSAAPSVIAAAPRAERRVARVEPAPLASSYGSEKSARRAAKKRPALEAKPIQAAPAASSSPVSSLAAASAAAASSSTVSTNETATPAAAEKRVAPAPAPKPAPAVDDSLAREIALISRARSALSRGDARAALSLADEHAASFAQGRLRQERLATRALALCALGRGPDARAAIRELERAAPRSPHMMRIREACSAQVDLQN